MRCRYCGSNVIHEDTRHETFSKGKAVAGAVMFGVVGAAAGFIGKDNKGYRCGACGAFMQKPMDFFTESSIDSAIREAETQGEHILFDNYKQTYPNIQANIPLRFYDRLQTETQVQSQQDTYVQQEAEKTEIKSTGVFKEYCPTLPIYLESYTIVIKDGQDHLSLTVRNQSKNTIRSAYLSVEVYDDTMDLIDTQKHVYQQLEIRPGALFPEMQLFPLNTELAFSVKVTCEKIAYTDNSVWKNKGNDAFYPLEKLKVLDAENCILPVYAIDFYTKKAKRENCGICYMPQRHETWWTCVCGCPVPDKEPCTKCGLTEEEAFSCVDSEELTKYRIELISGMAKSRADKLSKLKEEALRFAYDKARKTLQKAKTPDAYAKAAALLRTLHGYKDADELEKQAEDGRKDVIYNAAVSKMTGEDARTYTEAIQELKSISGWRDADEKIENCKRRIKEIKAKEEADHLERERQAEQKRLAAEKAEKRRKRIIAVAAAILVACIAFVIVLNTVIIPSGKYNSAMELYNAQKYEDAYKAFNSLNYKDSADKAAECLFPKQKAGLTNVTVGSIIKFGFYEQDNNTSNGKEEIEWKVLAVEGNKALVISQYALDHKLYNNKHTDTTWEKCTLRKWLNGTFYNNAFGAYHQKMIASSTVTADKNLMYYSTSPGNNTTDNVFLLSITEVEKYFDSDEARKCAPTDYAIAQGVWTSDSYKTGGRATCWWWLRSPGYDSDYAALVRDDGSVNYFGHGDGSGDVVRPALWINLGS